MTKDNSFTSSDGKLAKPPQGYTNTDWQRDFTELKQQAQDEPALPAPNSLCGLETSYDAFLDSVLYAIRHGQIDYCYYIYQIVDLLKYEKNLQSRWLEKEQQFRVWL